MNAEHLGAGATTVFEALADAGFVTAAVNFTAYRGRTRQHAATPREARPWARSRNGLAAPTVSSRSFGPEPWTSTTAGNGPLPTGIASVPGTDHSPEPTVTSRSRNASFLA